MIPLSVNVKNNLLRGDHTMTITSFNPQIVTRDAEATIALFEALGFERIHTKNNINELGMSITAVRMKCEGEDGKVFHVDVTSAPVPQDITTIRMNTRAFDETYRMLEEKGFKNSQGERIANTGSSRIASMVSPSGFSISVVEHFRHE